MPSLLLALVVCAWPVPRDAGAEAWADPANWPDEPGWATEWPLRETSAADAGPGLGVDRAWSVTRGAATITLAVVSGTHALGDPLLSRWRLNPGELPPGVDLDGDGVVLLEELRRDPRLTDRGGDGQLGLDDVQAAFADGLDDDGNGRVDDLCGWDVTAGAPLADTPDAGFARWRTLAAPVDDGQPGAGVCPRCSLLPVGAGPGDLGAALDFAAAAGARVVVLPESEEDLDSPLLAAMARHPEVLLIATPVRGAVPPLSLHPGVLAPRPVGPAGAVLGCESPAARVAVPSRGCGEEPALRLAGVAGLLWAVNPALPRDAVLGLLGAPRVDVAAAVGLAEGPLPSPLPRRGPLEPRTTSPGSDGERCELADAGPVSCDAGVPWTRPLAAPLEQAPWGSVIDFVERAGPLTWVTPFLATPAALRRGELEVTDLGWGRGPPRYVDVDGLGSDAVLAVGPGALRGLTGPGRVETLAPLATSGALAPAFGDLFDDRRLDVVSLSPQGRLDAASVAGTALPGFPIELGGAPAGPPVLASGREGTLLFTVLRSGRVEARAGASRTWAFEAGAPIVSAAAVGDADGDGFVDVAFATADTVQLLLADGAGPRSASWSRPSRAGHVLLADLTGDGRLELLADQVFDWTGGPRVHLDGWQPPVTPPALARLGTGPLRSLVQLEAASDGAFSLVRYEVELAARQGASLAERRVLAALRHRPARGGFAVADVTGDGRPDVLLPTEDGLLFVIDGEGRSPAESPWPAEGSVVSAPAVGVTDDRLEYAVRTTRGDLVRWVGTGLPEDIAWESSGHDRGNTRNAEHRLPVRRLSGLGITSPPVLADPGCGCAAEPGAPLLALLVHFALRRRRKTC